MPSDGSSRPQLAARVVLALLLAAFGLWTLHRYLPALVWAAHSGHRRMAAVPARPAPLAARQAHIMLPTVFTLVLG